MEIDRTYFKNLLDKLELALKKSDLGFEEANSIEGTIFQGKLILQKEDEKQQRKNSDKITKNFVTKRHLVRSCNHLTDEIN